MQVLEGHTDEIFSCAFNYEGDTIITGELTFGSADLPCSVTAKQAHSGGDRGGGGEMGG